MRGLNTVFVYERMMGDAIMLLISSVILSAYAIVQPKISANKPDLNRSSLRWNPITINKYVAYAFCHSYIIDESLK